MLQCPIMLKPNKNLSIIALTLAVFFLGVTGLSAGPIEPMPFSDPVEEKRYMDLIEELRCLKCQNQNIADSNADLAMDLRRKVYNMIVKQKMSDMEIKEWMLARYGDFVLYSPPVKSSTWMLWAAPFIILPVGVVLLLMRLRNRSESDQEQEPEQQLSAEDREKARKLLEK